MNKKMTFTSCIKHLWPFLRPYRFKLFVGIFMIIVAQITFAINPSVEGMITTQLSKDVMDIAQTTFLVPIYKWILSYRSQFY